MKLLGLGEIVNFITPPQLRSPLPCDGRGVGYHRLLVRLPTPMEYSGRSFDSPPQLRSPLPCDGRGVDYHRQLARLTTLAAGTMARSAPHPSKGRGTGKGGGVNICSYVIMSIYKRNSSILCGVTTWNDELNNWRIPNIL